ncbi:hypothetical protein L6452_18051 [Arctium lappa]|uniref:Uncharacterized protein n=1 Tax=Arctium lappa TaxID=4217 RepID=A0ACB9C525_ARCLA|nr:hypothetical protein L6452_18051 [Arctium lappa]
MCKVSDFDESKHVDESKSGDRVDKGKVVEMDATATGEEKLAAQQCAEGVGDSGREWEGKHVDEVVVEKEEDVDTDESNSEDEDDVDL